MNKKNYDIIQINELLSYNYYYHDNDNVPQIEPKSPGGPAPERYTRVLFVGPFHDVDDSLSRLDV